MSSCWRQAGLGQFADDASGRISSILSVSLRLLLHMIIHFLDELMNIQIDVFSSNIYDQIQFSLEATMLQTWMRSCQSRVAIVVKNGESGEQEQRDVATGV